MSDTRPQHIAILGFGFSGLMAAANLVRAASTHPLTLYLVAPEIDGLGIAYRTRHTAHLLNVPAAKMGAFADAPEGFYQWLQTPAAMEELRALGVTQSYAATDFAPRVVYAAYLRFLWRETQHLAAQKNITLAHVPSRATGITQRGGITVLTERGDAIAVDRIILATGHEAKPVMQHLPAGCVIQDPWDSTAFADASGWHEPVVLMGAGLTAVDTVLTLRSAGYSGEIIAFSRHGLLPQPHATYAATEDFFLPNQPSPLALSRSLRTAARRGPWRAAVDALRPHTQVLWQKFSTQEQRIFIARLLPFWNVHRHRMAPEIAASIAAEIATGKLRVLSSHRYDACMKDSALKLTLHTHHGLRDVRPAVIINCTGPQMDPAKSSSTLLRQALADGIVEPHATGLGIAVDPQYRAWGALHPYLYVVGPLMTGQLLESTAVPELRVQASAVATAILSA